MTLAVDAYEKDMRVRELAGASILRARAHLDTMFKIDVNGGKRLRWLSARVAAQLYTDVQVGRAVDTHRGSLAVARRFGTWCVRQGWLMANPFADVVGIGRRKRGKPQLRVDEARRLLATCIADETREGTAIAVALLLGLRASEVTNRQVRDLDDHGKLLWVPKGKTASARRHLEVPDVIRGQLIDLAGKRPGAAWLFGAADIERPSRYWLHYHCRRLCGIAKVPIVPPHGLRGTHATLATAAGVTSHAVSAALGHASTEITEAAYILPGETARTTQRAAMRAIDDGTGNLSSRSSFQR